MFLENLCLNQKGLKTYECLGNKLYQHFKSFCEENSIACNPSGRCNLSVKSFGIQMSRINGFTKKRTKAGMFYILDVSKVLEDVKTDEYIDEPEKNEPEMD